MRANKVAILLLGLLIGGVAGYLTRPVMAQITVPQVPADFNDTQVLSGPSEGVTSAQMQHVLLYTIAGGVIGLLLGFALDRRRGF